MKQNLDKAIAGAGAAASYAVDFLGVGLIGLFALMVIDLVTGTLASKAQGLVITSERNQRGIIKKAGVLASVGMGGIVDFALPHALTEAVGIKAFSMGVPFLTFFVIWGIYNEVISITENLIRMDVPIPSIFVRYINSTKKKMDNAQDDKKSEEKPEKEQENTGK